MAGLPLPSAGKSLKGPFSHLSGGYGTLSLMSFLAQAWCSLSFTSCHNPVSTEVLMSPPPLSFVRWYKLVGGCRSFLVILYAPIASRRTRISLLLILVGLQAKPMPISSISTIWSGWFGMRNRMTCLARMIHSNLERGNLAASPMMPERRRQPYTHRVQVINGNR